MRHVPVQEEIAAGPCIGRHPWRASARRHPWRKRKGRTKKDLDWLHAHPAGRGSGDSRYGRMDPSDRYPTFHFCIGPRGG
jgi:hypothetical protein